MGHDKKISNTGAIIIIEYVCANASKFLRGLLNARTIKRVKAF